jgi:hypothetical protein
LGESQLLLIAKKVDVILARLVVWLFFVEKQLQRQAIWQIKK